jgi:cytosine/adenosine deaminase-related metal-dependent hydrolase
VDDPPLDADDWTDEQWQAYLRASETDHPEVGATVFRRVKQSGAGAVIGAGMLGLEQALYGERPKEEVVAEAESDDPGRDRSVFDPDDPGSAVISLAIDPPPRAEDS